jgi:hypothetical protein
MKLQELAWLVPGADVRVRAHAGRFLVEIRQEWRTGTGNHQQLTFATARAILALRCSSTPESVGSSTSS